MNAIDSRDCLSYRCCMADAVLTVIILLAVGMGASTLYYKGRTKARQRRQP